MNADDFGLSAGVNDGIVTAHRHGIVTTTSLMVRQPAAAEAVELWRDNVALAVGLHVDMGEWRFDGDEWVAVYQWVDTDDAEAVELELERQLAAFESLTGTLPTHLDSHQHVHQREPLRSLLCALAARLEVPLRHVTPHINYEGGFYGQTDDGRTLADRVSVDRLVEILIGLPDGFTELCCHPAARADVETAYRDERVLELAVLCDPAVRSAMDDNGIALCSFREVRR